MYALGVHFLGSAEADESKGYSQDRYVTKYGEDLPLVFSSSLGDRCELQVTCLLT